MFAIINKEELGPGIKKIVVEAKYIAKKAETGEFVIIRLDEKGERIPLTLADWNKDKGTISLIFQEVGFSTYRLGKLNIGDSLLDVVGPLGRPTHLEKYKGKVICIGGGVGIAEVYPVSRALKSKDNKVIGIIGARNEDLLILEDKMRSLCEELYITTDDGSYGERGFVTEVLRRLLSHYPSPITYDLIYAIGPVVMMKKVCEITRSYNIKTVVNLNSVMVDGTGMCGSCRVRVGGKTLFVCVDGPEFDGHLVDFDELESRLNLFKKQEEQIKCARQCGSLSQKRE